MQYTSIWVIDRHGLEDVVRLHDLSWDLGYILWHYNVTTSDGYSALRFFIEVPHPDELTKFLHVGQPLLNCLGLTEWRRLAPKDEIDHIFEQQIRLSQLSDGLLKTIMRSFHASAQYNEDLRASRSTTTVSV
jgi:hypothetical protein